MEVTYSALISACDKVAQWEMALHLLQEPSRRICDRRIPMGLFKTKRRSEKKNGCQDRYEGPKPKHLKMDRFFFADKK